MNCPETVSAKAACSRHGRGYVVGNGSKNQVYRFVRFLGNGCAQEIRMYLLLLAHSVPGYSAQKLQT